VNIPNLLSALRIVLIPLFLYLLFVPSFSSRIWALVVFAFASLTDLVDGWSARKLNQETSFGKFLDPLADKFLVIAALVAFVILDPLVSLWMVFVIFGRDLMITLMRYLAIKKGEELRTSQFGKIKTAFQMISIIVIIMVFIVRSSGIDVASPFIDKSHIDIVSACDVWQSGHPNRLLIIGPYVLMMIVTVLTALSGVRYLFTNWRLLLPPYVKRDQDGR